MSFVWYEVELPYQDKTFFAGSLENANRMALDLHKDFFPSGCRAEGKRESYPRQVRQFSCCGSHLQR